MGQTIRWKATIASVYSRQKNKHMYSMVIDKRYSENIVWLLFLYQWAFGWCTEKEYDTIKEIISSIIKNTEEKKAKWDFKSTDQIGVTLSKKLSERIDIIKKDFRLLIW